MKVNLYDIEGETLTSKEVIERARAISRNKVAETTIRKRLLSDGKRTWAALAKSSADALRDARAQFASHHAVFYKQDQLKRDAAAKSQAQTQAQKRYEKAQAELEILRQASQNEAKGPNQTVTAQERYEKAQAELEILRKKAQQAKAQAKIHRPKNAAAQPAIRADQDGGPREGRSKLPSTIL